MKWSELDEKLIVRAACFAVERRVVWTDLLVDGLEIDYEVADRLINQMVELKVISQSNSYFDALEYRVFFSTRDSVQTYLYTLSKLGEFTQADIDRYDFMRSIQHWKYYDAELQIRWNGRPGHNPTADADKFYNRWRFDSIKHIHPQLMFNRSAFQRVLYSTRLVGAILVSLPLMLVVLMIEIGAESAQAEYLIANPLVQIGLVIVASIFWQPAWKKHLKSPIELYWVGDHFEAVFPDGTLDHKPDLSNVLFNDSIIKKNGWVSLRPTSKYIGAKWARLKEVHQAWMDAQKKE
jgi:hypothetical protein